jgi:hypothetical protein
MPTDILITAPVQKSRFTVTSFYDKVRGNCMLRSSNRVTDADILEWLCEAQDEIALATHWYRTSSSINVVAGTKEYDLPNYCLGIEEAWYNPDSRVLVPSTAEDLSNMSFYSPNWRYTPNATPIYYYVNANSAIGLHPTPDTSTTSALFLVYSSLPARPTTGADFLFHPPGGEKACIDYACWKASLKDATGEGGKREQQFRASWVERLNEIKRQVEGLYEENMTVLGEFGTPFSRRSRVRADWEDGGAITSPG